MWTRQTQVAETWAEADLPVASVAVTSSANGPTYEPEPKSHGSDGETLQTPFASVVANPRTVNDPSGGLAISTARSMELEGAKPVPTIEMVQLGHVPDTVTVIAGAGGAGGAGGT